MKPFKVHAIGMVILLTIQYILGMYTNLFVSFPDRANEGELWEFAWHQMSLASHIIVGIALLLGAIVLLVRSLREHNTNWIISSTIAMIAILTAGGGGALFISKQSDGYSFLMAASFLVALLAYFWGMYKDVK